MKRNKRTAVKRVLAATAASAVGILGALVVAASPAEAICQGVGHGVTMTNYYNGHLVAQERWVTGTCDNDDVYVGELRDPYNDGYAARARFKDGSYNGIVAYSSGDWNRFTVYDQTGDSYAHMQIYSSPASRPGDWWVQRGF
jgi:hypothetical protein